MPYEWVYSAAGGGAVGLLALLLVIVILAYWRDLKGQIAELRASNKDLRDAINRVADTIEAWTPDQQRRLKRP